MEDTGLTQGKYRHRASFGKRQEYIAVAELLRRGYDVYMPLVDDQQIDCIIRRGDHDYVDLQIKARSRDCKPANAGRFALDIPNPREKYFFLFYSESIKTYWIFPSNKLVTIFLPNKKGKNKGKYNVRLTGFRKNKGGVYARPEFRQYENNFGLLRT